MSRKKKTSENDIGISLLLGNIDEGGIIDKETAASLGGIPMMGGKFSLFADLMEDKKEDELGGYLSDEGEITDDEQDTIGSDHYNPYGGHSGGYNYYYNEEEDFKKTLLSNPNYLLSSPNDSNPILCYSNIFGPKESQKYKLTVKYLKSFLKKLNEKEDLIKERQEEEEDSLERLERQRQQPEIQFEEEEEDNFFENSMKVIATSKKISEINDEEELLLRERQSEGELKEQAKKSDLEQAKKLSLDEKIFQRCSIEPVDQVYWEGNIIWDLKRKGEDEDNIMNNNNIKQKSNVEKQVDNNNTNKAQQQGSSSSLLGLGVNALFHHDDSKAQSILTDLSGIPKIGVEEDGKEWGFMEDDEIEKERELLEKQKQEKEQEQQEKLKPVIPETHRTFAPSAITSSTTDSNNNMDISGIIESNNIEGSNNNTMNNEGNGTNGGSEAIPQENSNLSEGEGGGDDAKKPRRKYTRRKKKNKPEENNNSLLMKLSSSTLKKPSVESNAADEEDDFLDPSQQQQQVKFLNESLLNGDWLDSVAWGDDSGPKVPPNTKLILDMNDKSMFFKEVNEPQIATEQLTEDVDIDSTEYNVYNISNDSKYEDQSHKVQAQKATAKKHTVRHSLPALRLDNKLYRTHIPDHELRRLHHRRHKFKPNEVMPILFRKPRKEKKRAKKKKDIERKQDLSANDHRVVLMEYIEEKPSMLNNVGMATMIMNYYKKPNSALDRIPECEDGIPIVVDSEDSVPLISTLVDGEFLTTTENNMFRAQIFKHEPKPTDFLLCTRKSSNGKTKFYIREIPKSYTVGHTQPQVEVPPPRTRISENFTNNRLTLFIYRCFLDQMKKGCKTLKIKIDDIKEAFPDIPHQTIRERLKDFAKYDRGSSVWLALPTKPIPSEDELCSLVSPEMVCANEAMLSGDLRLNDKAIDDEASMVAFELSFAKVEGRIRDTIRFIEREKIELPWDKTNNFHLCLKGGREGVKLQLLSVVYQNITDPEKLKVLVDETEKRIQSEIEEILPSMTDTEAKRILIKNKYTEEQLKNMTRADRKMNARKILKQQGYQPGVEYNRETLFDDTSGGAMDSNAIDNRKNAKEIARINIFREVLQDIFFREAMKLEHGLNFYETYDEVIDQLIEKKLGRLKGDKELELQKMMTSSIQQRLKDELEESDNEAQGGTGTDGTGKKRRGRKSKQQQVAPNLQDLGKKYYVKKTKFLTTEEGVVTEKVEFIRDPEQVNYYIAMKESKSKKKNKHFWGASEHEILLVGPRERGRLQAMSRQFKKKFHTDKQTASEKLSQEKKKRTTAIKNASVTTTRKKQTKKKKQKREMKREQELQKRKKRVETLKQLDTGNVDPNQFAIPSASSSSSSSKKKEKSKSKDDSSSSKKKKEEKPKKKKETSEDSESSSKKKRKSTSGSSSKKSSSGTDGNEEKTKRRSTSNEKLKDILSNICEQLYNDPLADSLRNDLVKIKEKVINYYYTKIDTFLSDVESAVRKSSDNVIPLYEKCKKLVEQNQSQIDNLEQK
ncbi:hypothetical protein ABK040_002703 [Willaertia magna]